MHTNKGESIVCDLSDIQNLFLFKFNDISTVIFYFLQLIFITLFFKNICKT